MHFIYLALLFLTQHFYVVRTNTQDLTLEKSSSFFGQNQIQATSVRKDKRYLKPAEVIAIDGYPSETHRVTTEDGYILTIFRIPGKNGSKPVYVQHGFLQSGADFLAPGKGRSLAYILHDNGFDVWLGNARGNTFSQQHVNLTNKDPKFWDFSATEVGIYDLPAVFDHVTTLTGQRLFYISHSMGSTFLSIMAIERPDVAKKVKAMIGLAPATYINHVKSVPFYALAPVSKIFYHVTKALNIHKVFGRGVLVDTFLKYACGLRLTRHIICENSIYALSGYSPKQMDSSILPQLYSTFPSGTSVKLYVHLLQQIHSNKTRFHKFDYGKDTNTKIYGSPQPPPYDLSKMQIPTAAFYANNDIVAVPQDVQDFYKDVPVKLGIYQVQDRLFNHEDFVIGKGAPTLVYPKILQIMSDFDKKSNGH